MSYQWQTSIRGHCCVLNHWPHRGAWAHTVTLAQYCKPLSEVIGMYQNIGHMVTHGHILTHELTMNTRRGCRYVSNHWPHGGTWIQVDTIGHNEQKVSEFIGMYQTIGYIGAYGHMQTHECTMYIKYWRLQLCLK